MSANYEFIAHQEWLGYLQPVGLVVSPPALAAAGAFPNKNIIPDHTRFLDVVEQVTPEGEDEPTPAIRDFPRFATEILGWEPADLLGCAGGEPVPESLEVALPEYNETLRPSYAVPEFDKDKHNDKHKENDNIGGARWLMLIQRVKLGLDLDDAPETDSRDHRWQASPQARFERLLRETQVPIGLLSNGTNLRLVYAPRGETSGHLTFPVRAMTEVAGRPIFAALLMLLSAERLFTLADRQRLPFILSESRKYQNLVSTKLSEQVLAALYELLRGFQAADDQRHGDLLRDVLKDDPNQVYGGLLRVLLRLVFLLYAEDRSLLSNDEVYQKYYSVIGLFERLREDDGRYTDTMDHRFGAWAQLLTLFRLIYDGGRHGGMKLPARKGYLFDPDRYPFLEGRSKYEPEAQASECSPELPASECSSASSAVPPQVTLPIPRVSDGVVFRVLKNLLILDGERLSYRTLDVEQIGSVYEAVMGMELVVAAGRSIALRLPKKNKGTRPPVTIDLEDLLAKPDKDRKKTLTELAEWDISGRAESALKAAKSIEDLMAVLEARIHRAATPFIVPKGAMVLQPSDERRRSGSHYTPRSLTEPIVRTTLRPVLERLGAARSKSEGIASGCVAPMPIQARSASESVAPMPIQARSASESVAPMPIQARSASESVAPMPIQARSASESVASMPIQARSASESVAPMPIQARSASESVASMPIQARSASESVAPDEDTHSLALRARNCNLTPEQILDLKVCDPAMGSGAFLVAACRLLAELFVSAWHHHKCVPVIPPDEDEILHARRIVAQRCLYGVDKNPMAADLAKLSLWLATLAKDHPFTFLDHALRCGDSLVGLSKQQIEAFHWKPEQQRDFARGIIEGKIRRAIEGRLKIQNASEFEPYLKLDQELALVEEALDRPRFYGDLVVSAFFAGSNDRQRKERLDELADTLAAHLAKPDFLKAYPALVSARDVLRSGEKAVTPFHWEIEFAEVFARDNPGFDAIVGNPPFLGGKQTSTVLGDEYLDFLLVAYPESHGNADLIAFFFRRAFQILRRSGTFGLIATNTIAQGDTRTTGLQYICLNQGAVVAAQRRLRWPGQAAVIVSSIHVQKGSVATMRQLDGKPVDRITSFLFRRGTDLVPSTLSENRDKSFLGFKIYGQGFLFDDDDEIASPIESMHRLVESDSLNADIIFPYMGGQELNSSPTLSPSRFAINFGSRSEEEARRWPALLSLVAQKVRPERNKLKRRALAERWWQYGERQPSLVRALAGLERTVAIARVGNHAAFAFLPTGIVYSEQLVVIPLQTWQAFCALQSRPHEVWARFFASSMKDDMRYTPSDCFETFPFPLNFETDPTLEQAGKTYYDFRAALMVKNNEGLTKTYNRFHDPDERSPGIRKLRELHAAMDRAVLDAYGWTDLKPTCEFLLDYEDEDEELGDGSWGVGGPDSGPSSSSRNPGSRRRRKPWRYRWPDDFRDEVLARLLELNRQRAEEERLSGAAAEGGLGKTGTKSRARRKAARRHPEQPEFFES